MNDIKSLKRSFTLVEISIIIDYGNFWCLLLLFGEIFKFLHDFSVWMLLPSNWNPILPHSHAGVTRAIRVSSIA